MSQEFRQPNTDKRPLVFDWTAWLLNEGGDTISSSTMSVLPVGLTINTPAASFSGTTATVWVSGGTTGVVYNVYNTITTSGGRIRTKVIKVTIGVETP